MKKKMRKWIALMAGVIFLGSGAMVGYQHYQYHLGEQAYTEAEELAGVPDFDILADPREEKLPPPPPQVAVEAPAEEKVEETDVELPEPEEEKVVWVDPYADALAAMDFTALRQVNPEVLGWILIPGTNINFPITQGADNTFYLGHSWDGSPNQYGSIFLECMNSPDLTDFNTIIYGHRMNDGSMFASLHDFAQQDYWSAHPYVYIVTGDGVYRYEIFSTYVADTDSSTYGLSFNQEQTRIDFLRMALENSEIDTGITPATTDRIITLSTCTTWGYGSRRVVHARLRMIEQ